MSSPQVYEIAFRLGASVNSNVRSSFNNATKQLSNLETKSGLANKSMKLLATAAVATTAAIGGLTVGLGAAVKASNEFSSSMQQIQASTGASKKEIAEIKEISKNLYNKNLGTDWNDLSIAISTTRSVTQLTGKALQEATQNAIVYRDVWGEDISQSIKASDTMMKNFGITSTQAYNLLAQGAQNGLNKSDELLDSANEYAPYFSALGFNANQMFDTFSAGLANGAFNLDKVGDAVKEFNIRAKDGSKGTMAAYQALGMDANKMMQIFAKGGPEAQKSFQTVVQAISQVQDPVKKNEIGIALMGTMFEDLEADVVAAMGTAQKQFDMTKNTMEQVQNIKYDTLGNAIRGIGRQLETGLLIPLGDKLLPVFTEASKGIGAIILGVQQLAKGERIPFIETMTKAFGQEGGLGIIKFFFALEDGFERGKTIISSFVGMIQGQMQIIAPVIMPVFQQVGSFIMSTIQNIMGFWEENGSKIISGISTVVKVISTIGSGVFSVFQNVFTIVMPILTNIINFAMNIIGQLADFWAQEGTMIIQAVQNVFSIISGIIKFLAPVILFIINMVWTNVKGVIQGALNVIMGIIKIFAGLFTGDFRKMWEGVKQLFIGAIQVVWNLINLLFFGKILGGIKSFATGAITRISTMWTSIKTFFSGGATAIWNRIVELVPKVVSGFNMMKDKAVGIALKMWNGVKAHFDDIVSGAKSLPGKIGEGIASMAGKALSGITSMGNTLLTGIGKVVNGVIKGINWVLGKIGVDMAINEWKVPQYARGTNSHPGGLAVLGDGGGPELYRTPQGQVGLSPGTDTLMNLPKGTQVIPAKQTAMIMANQIPFYAKGTGVLNGIQSGASWIKDKTKNAGNWAKDKASDAGSWAKDKAIDVFDYISDPEALLNKVLNSMGVSAPNFSGAFGNISKGAFSFVKEKAVGFLKGKFKDIGSFSGGVAAPGQVQAWIRAAISATGVPMSWLGPLQTIAMKESGGNPRAYNDWDSNAKKGIASRGLMQTIPPTFNSFKLPGMNDIFNPVHNAVAAIRYIKSRYGTVFNTPGIRAMAKGKPYEGYAKGGRVPNTQWAWVGEQGPELMRLPGGTKVFNHEESKSLMNGVTSYANGQAQPSTQSTDNLNLSFPFSPVIHANGGNIDENTIIRALSAGHDEFKRMVKQVINDLKFDENRLNWGDKN